MIRNPIASAFFERLRDSRESTTGSAKRLSDFITKKTYLHGKPFSFKQHEFQKEIIDSASSVVSIIKSSQVGLSEISARACLAILATTSGITSMYCGPTVAWVQLFVKSRIDSVILESPALRDLMRPGADSSRLKILGTSFLHTAGLFGGNPVISIPVDYLLVDELDFCSEESTRTAESRLSHSRFVDVETGVRGLRRYFSTPTASDIGIAGMYAKSDKRKRLCKCLHCHEWFWPDFLTTVVVDGFDKPFDELTATDVVTLEKRGLVDTARMVCPHCHNTVNHGNLGPAYREWVAEAPSVKGHAGFWVDVFSVPDYHTPASVMRKMVSYGSDIANFRNFTLGHPYEDATNSVLEGSVAANTVVTPVPPENAPHLPLRGCFMGVDVGKTSWAVIGKFIDKKLHIFWAEQIKLQTADGSDLVSRVLFLAKSFGVLYGVMDAYPYSDSCLNILSRNLAMQAATFTLRDKTLPMFMTKDDSREIAVNRTKLLDLTVKHVNSGYLQFPRFDETLLLNEHLRAIRKVKRTKESGDVVEEWVSSRPDHYAFATAYMVLASTIVEQSFVTSFAVPVSIKQAVPGKNFKPTLVAAA